MTDLTVPDSPKMLRETLCVAQARVGNSPLDEDRKWEHIERLGRLIAECDRHRPLGTDGKHGNLHTATCGCEDVPANDNPDRDAPAPRDSDLAQAVRALVRRYGAPAVGHEVIRQAGRPTAARIRRYDENSDT